MSPSRRNGLFEHLANRPLSSRTFRRERIDAGRRCEQRLRIADHGVGVERAPSWAAWWRTSGVAIRAAAGGTALASLGGHATAGTLCTPGRRGRRTWLAPRHPNTGANTGGAG